MDKVTRQSLQALTCEWERLHDNLRLTTLRLDAALERVKELEDKARNNKLINIPNTQGDTHLTRKQQEVLRWAALGKTNIEIGMILNCSPVTVKSHMQSLLSRLQCPTRAAAAIKAVSLGILKTQ